MPSSPRSPRRLTASGAPAEGLTVEALADHLARQTLGEAPGNPRYTFYLIDLLREMVPKPPTTRWKRPVWHQGAPQNGCPRAWAERGDGAILTVGRIGRAANRRWVARINGYMVHPSDPRQAFHRSEVAARAAAVAVLL